MLSLCNLTVVVCCRPRVCILIIMYADLSPVPLFSLSVYLAYSSGLRDVVTCNSLFTSLPLFSSCSHLLYSLLIDWPVITVLVAMAHCTDRIDTWAYEVDEF